MTVYHVGIYRRGALIGCFGIHSDEASAGRARRDEERAERQALSVRSSVIRSGFVSYRVFPCEDGAACDCIARFTREAEARQEERDKERIEDPEDAQESAETPAKTAKQWKPDPARLTPVGARLYASGRYSLTWCSGIFIRAKIGTGPTVLLRVKGKPNSRDDAFRRGDFIAAKPYDAPYAAWEDFYITRLSHLTSDEPTEDDLPEADTTDEAVFVFLSR